MPREPGRYDSVCGSIFGILPPLPRRDVVGLVADLVETDHVLAEGLAVAGARAGSIASQPDCSGVPSFGLK